jgi:hypothetical protein
MMTQTQIDTIVELRAQGQTLQQIGDRYDLTRERIRQILAAEGITGTPWTGFKLVHYRRLAKAVSWAATLTVRNAKPGDEHFPHGTVNGYARGCSCERCRTANRERCYAHNPPRSTPKLGNRVARNDGSRRAAIYYERARKGRP